MSKERILIGYQFILTQNLALWQILQIEHTLSGSNLGGLAETIDHTKVVKVPILKSKNFHDREQRTREKFPRI